MSSILEKISSYNIFNYLFPGAVFILTTKTGDVIVKSIEDHTGIYEAINPKANSTEVSSRSTFASKK